MKDKLTIILSVICVILIIFNIGSCNNAYRQKSARDKEMGQRLDLEERLSKFNKEKTVTLEKLQKDLEDEKAAHLVSKKALTEEQLINQSLKEELQKVVKVKDALEKDLKEALAGKKVKK